MAVDSNLETLVGAIAGASMANQVYRFVSLDTTVGSPPYRVLPSAAVGAMGVAYTNPPTGEAVTVVIGGVVKIVAGAAVAIGATVDSDATGRAVTTAATRFRALTAATVAGQIIEVLIQ